MANREESPDSTTKNKHSKKRVLSGNSDTHDSELAGESKLRKISKNSDNSANEEASASATVSVRTIPPCTSLWTSSVLDRLKIFVEKKNFPSANFVFNKWMKTVMASKKETIENLDTRVRNILVHMGKFEVLCKLDFDSCYDINSKSAPSFYRTSFECSGCTDWTRITPLKTEQHWSHLFSTSADKFAANVRYMGRIHSKGGTLTEAMYGNLFQDFIGLCGVQSFAAPIVETTNLKIGNTDVRSVPDMVILDQPLEADDDDWKTLVVIKHGNCTLKEFENFHPPEIKPKNSHSKSDLTINDKLIGQHGGELLLHCPMSLDKGGILGMIVQNTHVAFTHLSCDKNQLENIKNERFLEDNFPSMKISKFYNFLKASDREELVVSFITLGLLQTLPG